MFNSTLILTIQWIIVFVFGLVSLIALLSLLNIIKLEPKIKNKLFTTLVIGVITLCLSIAVRNTNDALINQPLTDFLNKPLDWQYAEKGWRCSAKFDTITIENEILYNFNCDVYWITSSNSKLLVANFKSTKPFPIKSNDAKISFDATQTYLPNAAIQDSTLKFLINKTTIGKFTLERDQALNGNFVSSSFDRWGVLFTRTDK